MDIKETEINPIDDNLDRINLTEEIVEMYSLDSWANNFSLMTAGYRDTLDEKDISNPKAPFNSISIAICVEAKARVFGKQLEPSETAHVHIGGEVRPHTQTFIKLAARIYSAHGMVVHLRKGMNTTPIWYSSFGIAYSEYSNGDNFTASHSPYYKGGWKPLDSEGKQLLAEEPDIIEEVKKIVANRETIRLNSWKDNNSIVHDFDVDNAYRNYQKYVFEEAMLSEIMLAGDNGFRCSICTVGGSMKKTSERLFSDFGIRSDGSNNSVIKYFYGEENELFHGIGIINGEQYGVDPSKWQVYKNIGAQERLLNGEADLIIIWDPDGDRIKIAATIPIAEKEDAENAGIEVDEHSSNDKCVIYFTPNQLYLMITAYRIEILKETGKLNKFDWFIGCSYPTTKSLEELAKSHSLRILKVPVGFKHIGDLCKQIEDQIEGEKITFTSVNGETTEMGKKPRPIILCEESGGATLGGSELLVSKTGKRKMLAIREKDGMQIGLMSISLASYLDNRGSSFCKYYSDIIGINQTERKIKCIHYDRHDIKLYEDKLYGDELKEAKKEGFKKRDQIVDFFKDLVKLYEEKKISLDQICQKINDCRTKLDVEMPKITDAYWIGDGSLFETVNFQFILRASGTDAVLRYYFDGIDKELLSSMAEMLKNLNVNIDSRSC